MATINKETLKIDKPVYDHRSSEPNENNIGNRVLNLKKNTNT